MSWLETALVGKDDGLKEVGNFIVEREIARGGMGVVLLARQPSLDRLAILKKVRKDLTNRSEAAKRFEREARLAATIHHQNVVAVYDLFSHKSDRFLAQEFVDGVDLCTVLDKKGALPWKIASLVLLEVARGLEEIHAHGTVHRDIKPSNILLSRRGDVKIADFGIALEPTGSALTNPGMMIGTPPYSPPEQLLGERMDARGDLFSVGVVLYTMLAGKPPFPDSSDEKPEGLLLRMQKERYRSLPGHVLPQPLNRVLRSCLRANASRRPASARELRRTLETNLGCPSPADCRAAIASWLWASGTLEKRPDETTLQWTSPPIRRPSRGPRLVAAGLVLLAVAAFLLPRLPGEPLGKLASLARKGGGRLLPAEMEELLSGDPSIEGAPAKLVLKIHPRATVLLDGKPVSQPKARGFLEVAPGPHRVVIEDETSGRAEHEISLGSGEEFVLSPIFRHR